MSIFESSLEGIADAFAAIVEYDFENGFYSNRIYSKQDRLCASLASANRQSSKPLEDLINDRKSPHRVKHLR